jgi:DNA polymerase III subunit gamma/tau
MENPNGMPSYLVLARKYRPTTFSEVVGQDHVIKTLSNAILSGRVAHAFLFCGVRGVGKTTVARIMAKALNCTGRSPGSADPCNQCTACREISAGISMDVQEIDGASNTSVENIREINENIKYPPVSSQYKIIIIDEVHMISINAFNALLKTLEEPPPHAKFMFATTESHKVPATINSRCQRFNFRTISVRDIIDGMTGILAKEGIEAEESALALVAREAQGSFRDALSLLDQVIAFNPQRIDASSVIDTLGISGRDCFGRLIHAVLDHDPAGALQIAHELFEHGYDPEQFVMDLIHYMRNLVVVRTVPAAARVEGLVDAAPSELEELERLAERASAQEFQNLFSMLLRAEAEVRRSANPWIA